MKDGLLRGYHFRRQRLVAGNAQITRKAGMRAAGNQYPDTLSRFDSIGRRGQGDDDVHAAVRLHLAATHFHTIDPFTDVCRATGTIDHAEPAKDCLLYTSRCV